MADGDEKKVMVDETREEPWKYEAERVCDMDGLILVPERMSLDPLRTVNMVVAKDYWMSRRAMEEKCKGRRKFRVQQRRKEQRSQSAGPLQACCWPPGKRWLRRQLRLWDD